MSILLLNGPPFNSDFWQNVQLRLKTHNLESSTFDFLKETDNIDESAILISNFIKENDIQNLVAHGFAVPAALQAAATTNLEHLFISNGPLKIERNWQKCLTNIPPALMKHGLHPNLSIPFYASSFAFRRLVVNPYVMDRDTIASLCKKNLSSPVYRNNVAKYLHSMSKSKLPTSLQSKNCTLIWGDSDPLFPIKNIDHILSVKSNISSYYIAGAQHFHPIERPWAIADAIHKLLPLRH
jgi:pimeloyl-ACP methyl ester carboxylesterase